MIARIFDYVIAPAGLLVAFAIVEAHLEGRTQAMLASFLTGCTLGLYFGLLSLKRRKSG